VNFRQKFATKISGKLSTCRPTPISPCDFWAERPTTVARLGQSSIHNEPVPGCQTLWLNNRVSRLPKTADISIPLSKCPMKTLNFYELYEACNDLYSCTDPDRRLNSILAPSKHAFFQITCQIMYHSEPTYTLL
jgi:hypothetical protein